MANWLGWTAIGYVLWISNLVLPLGLHRLALRRPGWWWFPVSGFAALAVARWWLTHPAAGVPVWAIGLVAIPFTWAMAFDGIEIWMWCLPRPAPEDLEAS